MGRPFGHAMGAISPPRAPGGDFDGDGKGDLAAVTTAGDLRLYVGDGKGALAAGKSMWPKV
ncbi:hypothetical protein [Streptomyces sp. NPDC096132]|uniref:hypothetical protein n=1 Tax=Streptomyces sp. NPDC096132 TaxID=3366075 RepID=UPI003806275D